MANKKISGVVAPILTPFDNDLGFVPELYVSHARWLLDNGMHYISPFGTTGEALSMSVAERITAVDALIDGGIDPKVLMPGAGLCNLPESVKLCRHAASRGCAAVMTLPPFFYKNPSDEGLFQYFVELIDRVDHPDLKICLYHIPPMAVVGFSPALAGHLAKQFPEIVVAYKDSSGDFDNTKAVISAAPTLSVFPGSEKFLRAGLEYESAGCISATCNINPAGIRQVFDVATGARDGNLDQLDAAMVAIRKQVEGYAPIPVMKGLIANQRDESRWNNVRPPLIAASAADSEKLASSLMPQLVEF